MVPNWELQLAAAMTVEEGDLLSAAKAAREQVRLNRHGAALETLWTLLLTASRRRAARQRAFLLIHMGHVYRHWMIEVAFKYFRDARGLSREVAFTRGEMVAECSLGQLCLDWKEPERALARFERCLALAEECTGRWWQRNVLLEVVRCLESLGHARRARIETRRLDRLDAELMAELWGRPEGRGPGLAVAR